MDYDIAIDAIEIVTNGKMPIVALSTEKAIERKNKERSEIERHVFEYLEKGGKINIIHPGQVNFVAQFDPSERRRKKQAAKV